MKVINNSASKISYNKAGPGDEHSPKVSIYERVTNIKYKNMLIIVLKENANSTQTVPTIMRLKNSF